MFGEHNLLNVISGMVVAVNLGVPMEKIRSVVEKFKGAKRRQEVLLTDPVTVVDDFAHHPTEVAATVKAVRRRYPTGKLWALFEPRSATARRNVHQDAYAKAFASADHILIASAYRQAELNEAERFSPSTLVTALKAQGKPAEAFAGADELLKVLTPQVQPGDIVLVMSNGEFDKIQEKIVRAFRP
jgi:UDP-N-acetylmuramate: L-alanyl-gamma-D-glutamyl-meso-diaminopimelate ligase